MASLTMRPRTSPCGGLYRRNFGPVRWDRFPIRRLSPAFKVQIRSPRVRTDRHADPCGHLRPPIPRRSRQNEGFNPQRVGIGFANRISLTNGSPAVNNIVESDNPTHSLRIARQILLHAKREMRSILRLRTRTTSEATPIHSPARVLDLQPPGPPGRS